MSEKNANQSMENTEINSAFSFEINGLDNSINDITTYVLTSCTNRAIINFIDVRGVTTNTLKAGKHPPPAINASSKAWAIHAATGKLTRTKITNNRSKHRPDAIAETTGPADDDK